MQAHKNWVQCVSWSPDAVMVVSGDQNGVLWLWNPKTGETFGSCRGTFVPPLSMSFATSLHLLSLMCHVLSRISSSRKRYSWASIRRLREAFKPTGQQETQRTLAINKKQSVPVPLLHSALLKRTEQEGHRTET